MKRYQFWPFFVLGLHKAAKPPQNKRMLLNNSENIASFVEECPINLRVAYISRQTIVDCGRVWSNWETILHKGKVSRNSHIRLKETLLSCSGKAKVMLNLARISRTTTRQIHATRNREYRMLQKIPMAFFVVRLTFFCVVVAVFLFNYHEVYVRWVCAVCAC